MNDMLHQLNPMGVQHELGLVRQSQLGFVVSKLNESHRDGLEAVKAEQIARYRFFQMFRIRQFLFRVAPRWARIALF